MNTHQKGTKFVKAVNELQLSAGVAKCKEKIMGDEEAHYENSVVEEKTNNVLREDSYCKFEM